MGFNKEHVAECLRANRARRRMSRADLAEATGIPAATIKSYEDADSGISLENAWKIADVFDLDMDDLFERVREGNAA